MLPIMKSSSSNDKRAALLIFKLGLAQVDLCLGNMDPRLTFVLFSRYKNSIIKYQDRLNLETVIGNMLWGQIDHLPQTKNSHPY